MRAIAAATFVVLALGCGGGRVDPGFYGPLPGETAGEQRASSASRGSDARPGRFDRPKLVLIRADWCGVCHEVEPGIITGYAAYEDKVDLVVLDVTDARAIARSSEIARREGVSEFFDEFAGRTPTLGVFTRPEQARLVRGPIGDPGLVKRELEAAVERMSEPY
ncbi:MAG: thioredoxin family protein [Polyangiaceae bacterium]|nr:thioredoxin family protein [Polyangiaceae bacterium]